MMHYEDALARIPDTFSRTSLEGVGLGEALGRAVPAPVVSDTEHPPFAKAAMDGYALCTDDSSDEYEVLETLAAGDVPTREISHGTCSKIMTGAMVPDGADRVVRVEYTSEEHGRMRVLRPESGNNIIQRGENLKPGQVVLTPRMLRPQDIGVLASLGVAEVDVARRPIVGIIATGSELCEPGQPLDRGRIYNSNGHELYAQIRAAGGEPQMFGIIRDEPDALLQIGKSVV
jgi:molybdopterin molybdotransferase